ncbi:hypothetical protein A3Q56_05574 [Intoshia linei]|uniref:Small ribosomal subunit protein mS23 conserved domain-containing protein n=1 Tax=Intoshia linei TaxID=1819745 RepID=A0A177AXG2_9BILA|nr:hypothetical protein A3Q56_05574 [Intoshia linei]
MVGSRRHVFGTIYSRISGLLKFNVIKQNDIPIWYKIYEKYPPKYNIRKPISSKLYHEQDLVDDSIIDEIVFPEDNIRASIKSDKKSCINLFMDKPHDFDNYLQKYYDKNGSFLK